MSACVSPPHDKVSHIVHPAASIAAAASTALPPFAKIIAPAVAERGFPVIANQCSACRGGFCVRRGIGVVILRTVSDADDCCCCWAPATTTVVGVRYRAENDDPNSAPHAEAAPARGALVGDNRKAPLGDRGRDDLREGWQRRRRGGGDAGGGVHDVGYLVVRW